MSILYSTPRSFSVNEPLIWAVMIESCPEEKQCSNKQHVTHVCQNKQQHINVVAFQRRDGLQIFFNFVLEISVRIFKPTCSHISLGRSSLGSMFFTASAKSLLVIFNLDNNMVQF